MEYISSRKNKYIAHLRRLAADGMYRRECGEYVLDGRKLLDEAVISGARITSVLCSGESTGLPCPEYAAPEELLSYASPLKNSPGPVFTAAFPKFRPAKIDSALVLESVQDPGNTGTVVRCADAFGIGAVILTGNCADIFSPKAARATMGAIFRERIIVCSPGELREVLDGLPLYGAALSREALDIRSLDLAGSAVAVGSEGRGLSDELLSVCSGTVIIPMSGRCESLNAAVAASVIMWEMSRGR